MRDIEGKSRAVCTLIAGVGIIRIRDLKCRCGRTFVASDFNIADGTTITLTCGDCHDRPMEIER